MNLFNLFGTGNDLDTGSFVTINGKKWSESVADVKTVLAEIGGIEDTKPGVILSWLMGNFNSDYDFAKNLNKDASALREFNRVLTESGDRVEALKELDGASVVMQNFAKKTTEGTLNAQEFYDSITGIDSLLTTIESFGLQMLTTFGQMAVIWAVSEGIKLVVNAVQDYINRADIAKQKMEESVKTYQSTTDEVKTLNEELDENNKRIAEINGQDVITYTDQQELTKLETANKKLERQIELGTERIRLLPTRYYLK